MPSPPGSTEPDWTLRHGARRTASRPFDSLGRAPSRHNRARSVLSAHRRRFSLEELTVPRLVINARDDRSRRTGSPPRPHPGSRARLVTIEAAGHVFLGHDTEVREAIGTVVGE